jgi:hypothetical protein
VIVNNFFDIFFDTTFQIVYFVSMSIEKYISQLLYRYQCVTVPGFGAFITETYPASYNDVTQSFLPPSKKLRFNALIKHNDGLLASQIVLAENISFDDALALIDKEVLAWEFNLSHKTFVYLQNIGKFYYNIDGHLIFESIDQNEYLTSAFGLTGFKAPVIQRESNNKEILFLEEKTPITLSLEKRKRTSYGWLKYAAVFVIGIGTAGYYGHYWMEEKASNQQLVIEKNIQAQLDQKIQEATFYIDTPLNPIIMPTIAIADDSHNYHIVAGAFREEDNAKKEMQNLIEKGFKAKIIAKNRFGLHPVIYGSYPNREAAETAINSIRIQHNPDAWILAQELK